MEQKGFFHQDKKVLVADPDVLSFSVVDHKMQFAGILISIATDMTLIYNIIFFLTHVILLLLIIIIQCWPLTVCGTLTPTKRQWLW